MICEPCDGRGYVETREHGVDACKACAARAEAEWRLRGAAPRGLAIRIVTSKDEAA
jgi:hypothetical protein